MPPPFRLTCQERCPVAPPPLCEILDTDVRPLSHSRTVRKPILADGLAVPVDQVSVPTAVTSIVAYYRIERALDHRLVPDDEIDDDATLCPNAYAQPILKDGARVKRDHTAFLWHARFRQLILGHREWVETPVQMSPSRTHSTIGACSFPGIGST